MSKRIRVLVVDDSMLLRKAISRVLDEDPEIEVVGAAKDAYEAREMIKQLNPDVLTLDIEMPGMNGLVFLRNLMRLHPMPVVMVSTHTTSGAEATLSAFEYGAFDVVAKPSGGASLNVQGYAAEIIEKVKQAVRAPVKRLADQRASGQLEGRVVTTGGRSLADPGRVIAIGASTGGTEAVRVVLDSLPVDIPGVVITQHIPGSFSSQFAKRLNSSSKLNVKEAEDGEPIKPGWAYVAPGHLHLRVTRSGGVLRCTLSDGPPVSQHKPSVDVLFDSVATAIGNKAVAVLMTGMGVDGAQGLLQLREAGAVTICQDEKTSVVWGMPGEAVRLGATERIIPLQKIAEEIISGLVAPRT